MRVGILLSHPVQYYSPWFRLLAREVELTVYYAHQQTAQQQAKTDFGVAFDWDIDLLSGYNHYFLDNTATHPNVNQFWGCDTPAIYEEIKNNNFDIFIVLGWYLKCYWQAIWACRRLAIPVFCRGDSQLLPQSSWMKALAKNIVYPQALKVFDGFLSVGQRSQEYLKKYGAPKRKLFHVPHFVDNQWFADQTQKLSETDRTLLRKSLFSADEEQTVLLFVGKMIDRKRPLDIVNALAILQNRGLGVSAAFVGEGQLSKQVEQASLEKNVTCYFEGFRNQSELPKYYAITDAIVLPSDNETWGLVINEAMACGLPAIVSDIVGCGPDLIEPAETGYVFPCGDVEHLANCIEAMINRQKSGHDFKSAVYRKLKNYSVEVGVRKTIEAASTVVHS